LLQRSRPVWWKEVIRICCLECSAIAKLNIAKEDVNPLLMPYRSTDSKIMKQMNDNSIVYFHLILRHGIGRGLARDVLDFPLPIPLTPLLRVPAPSLAATAVNGPCLFYRKKLPLSTEYVR